MTSNVYEFPSVLPIVSDRMFMEQPVEESRSILTNRRYASVIQPKRRIYECAILNNKIVDGSPARGIQDALVRLLQGGVHYVRINHTNSPAVGGIVTGNGTPPQNLVLWDDGGTPQYWVSDGIPIGWYDDDPLTFAGTITKGTQRIQLTGLAPDGLYAAAGDLITVGSEVAMVAQTFEVKGGACDFFLTEPLKADQTGSFTFTSRESGIFEVTKWPSESRTYDRHSQNRYTWSFREVFAAEIGGTVEVSGWWRSAV